MDATSPTSDESLDALIERGLSRLRASSPESATLLDDAAFVARLSKVIVASDFALETLRKNPEFLAMLARDDGVTPLPPPLLAAEDSSSWPEQLRRYRTGESTRLVWRDVMGLDE